MALDPDSWDAGSTAHSEYRTLLCHLADNPSSAYQPSELVGVISGPYASAIERERCTVYLETLVELGKVQKRILQDSDQVFYRIDPAIVEEYETVTDTEAQADAPPEGEEDQREVASGPEAE